ncbi:hypothetical protein BN1723_020745, partial [Verticillium longisporum]
GCHSRVAGQEHAGRHGQGEGSLLPRQVSRVARLLPGGARQDARSRRSRPENRHWRLLLAAGLQGRREKRLGALPRDQPGPQGRQHPARPLLPRR